MSALMPDAELVKAYTRESSEQAFHALVQRHVDLVHATALRQMGDTGIAQEITQNVFLILARKAPRLAGRETLAGWLHLTTILECKARLRAELRRRQREETAAQIQHISREGESPLEGMLPLLDEALLDLRDSDRTAIMLRFLEGQSLRDVGQSLGIGEDAARKRIDRALERLTWFFQQRGFALPAGGAALFTKAAQAAPAGLAASSASAALAGATNTTTLLKLVLIPFMALTKTQTAMICALIALPPLAWQWRAEAKLAGDYSAVSEQRIALEKRVQTEDQKLLTLERASAAARNARTNQQTHLATLQSQLSNPQPPGVPYKWDDKSPVFRIPKALVDKMGVASVSNERGKVTAQVKAVLQLSATEAASVQAAVSKLRDAFHAAQAREMKVVEPDKSEIKSHDAERVVAFELPDVTAEASELRGTLTEEIERAIGPERAEIFAKGLGSWMQTDRSGISTSMEVLPFRHRLSFSVADTPEPQLRYHLSSVDTHTSMSSNMRVVDLPDFLRPHLEGLIQESRERAAAKQGKP
jgi:RNA polymerase sigma factor (sigma-70 family)